MASCVLGQYPIVSPPLVVEESHLAKFAGAIERVAELMHTSTSVWTEALGLARRVINTIYIGIHRLEYNDLKKWLKWAARRG